MDLFYLCAISLAIVYISLHTLLIIFRRNRKLNDNLPPGQSGLPVIGETLEYVLAARMGRPEKFISERMRKFSPEVFQTNLLGESLVVFCGASGNKFLFSGHNKYVTSWWPRSMTKALMFPSKVNKSAGEESSKLRSFLPEFLKPESLQHYIPIMDSMAREHLLEDWSPFEEVKVFPLSKKYTFALACRLFMSVDDPDQVEQFSRPFKVVAEGLMSVPIDLPGTTFRRAIKAGKVIREELLKIIQRRKLEILASRSEKMREEATNNGTTRVSKDLLESMLLAQIDDDDDDMEIEKDIANKIVGFFIASHDTTSTSITFVVHYLSKFPDIYEQVLKEQMEIFKSKGREELLNWNDIQKMRFTWNVACEAMRLAPPAQGAFREAMTDFTYSGFNIPKGQKTFWTAYTTHKNPQYFPDPEKFDPSRFEGKGPAPYTFVPFGGGPRMCPGKEYARLEILVFIHNLVTRYRWESLIPNEKIAYNPSPIPEKGLPIRLKPHPEIKTGSDK